MATDYTSHFYAVQTILAKGELAVDQRWRCLEPVIALQLVHHYRDHQHLNLLHHLVVQLCQDGLQVLHVELGQLAAIVQCSNLVMAH